MSSVPDKDQLLARYQRQCVLEHGHEVIAIPINPAHVHDLRSKEELIAGQVHAAGRVCGQPTTYELDLECRSGPYLRILTLGPPELVLRTLLLQSFNMGAAWDQTVQWEEGHVCRPEDLPRPLDQPAQDQEATVTIPHGYRLVADNETIQAGDIMYNGGWRRIAGELVNTARAGVSLAYIARPQPGSPPPGWSPWFTIASNGLAARDFQLLAPGEEVGDDCVMLTGEGWERVTGLHIGRKVEEGEFYGEPIPLQREPI